MLGKVGIVFPSLPPGRNVSLRVSKPMASFRKLTYAVRCGLPLASKVAKHCS